ncbi:hypothetical protein VP01_8972g1 [Puccinia sorghi]|uniref:Tc1-like transposase DDE domain-containing protein n=1 Tax=Puccinia sorghi TaxID=27349 RepID=A0A0L6UA18_9BASI|nr:hypothetical protein VP01_8972g1 [Puccinia sorghi]
MNARGSLINLIGTISEGGMIYMPSRSLSSPVNYYHGKNQDSLWGGFERVKKLLKESTKKINIQFLPKYLPFLNPIELAFNIIKTQIKHKEIK